MKITPGPWVVEGWDNESCMNTWGVRSSTGIPLAVSCNCGDGSQMTDVDAHVIAAAPEMLTALMMIAESGAAYLTNIQLRIRFDNITREAMRIINQIELGT